MSSLDDLEQRLAAVEAALASELPVLRAEAAAARALAAGADRDVAEYRSELRAHTRMLNALRETQVAHYGEHKADAAEIKADVAEIKAGVAQIVQMLEGLGGRRRSPRLYSRWQGSGSMRLAPVQLWLRFG